MILLTSEDDLADTIRPRLEALGADCQRILAIASIPGENTGDLPRAFAFTRDLSRLANLLSAMPDCRLLIVDPISAFLGNTNENGNAEVRSLIAALTTMARDRNIAVLAVSHFRKKEGTAIHRTVGSLAFTAGARAVWIICKDPAEADKRLFIPVKNNLAPNVTGLAFTIEECKDHGAPVVRWLPEAIDASAEIAIGLAHSAGRPDNERQHAMDWLQHQLADGPRSTRELREEADVNGISPRTLNRAFRELGGTAIRRGPALFSQWFWLLPGTACQNPEGEFWQAANFADPLADLFKPWPPPSPSRPPAPNPTPDTCGPTLTPDPRPLAPL